MRVERAAKLNEIGFVRKVEPGAGQVATGQADWDQNYDRFLLLSETLLSPYLILYVRLIILLLIAGSS